MYKLFNAVLCLFLSAALLFSVVEATTHDEEPKETTQVKDKSGKGKKVALLVGGAFGVAALALAVAVKRRYQQKEENLKNELDRQQLLKLNKEKERKRKEQEEKKKREQEQKKKREQEESTEEEEGELLNKQEKKKEAFCVMFYNKYAVTYFKDLPYEIKEEQKKLLGLTEEQIKKMPIDSLGLDSLKKVYSLLEARAKREDDEDGKKRKELMKKFKKMKKRRFKNLSEEIKQELRKKHGFKGDEYFDMSLSLLSTTYELLKNERTV